MNINQLRTLVTVAEAPSFAEAAAILFVTPAAVSQQLRQLEAEIGDALFDRSARPPRLNDLGESLLPRAREVVERFDAFRDFASADSRLRGRLVIGSVSGIADSLLPETLSALRRRYPDLMVRIEEGSSQVLVRRVRRGELDAALVSGDIDVPRGLEQVPLFSEPLVVVAPPESAAGGWREALTAHPFLRLNRHAGVGRQIDACLRRGRVRVEEAMELDSSDAIVQMALAGLGAGAVPRGRVGAEAARLLKMFPHGQPQVARQVMLVERANQAATDHAAVFLRELQARLAARG